MQDGEPSNGCFTDRCLCAAGFKALLSSRYFQAGFKYYLAVCSALIITVILSATTESVRVTMPIFGIMSVVVGMKDKVEATITNVSVLCLYLCLHRSPWAHCRGIQSADAVSLSTTISIV